MRPDFAVFILTHGRPDRVLTYKSLRRCGYTGPIYLVVDDEDSALDRYRATYGDQVLTFSKEKVAQHTDAMDNLPGRNVVLYARNACFDLAESVGVRYFMQLDDDYSRFDHRFSAGALPDQAWIRSMDTVLELLVAWFAITPFASIALGQGGDYFGGRDSTSLESIKATRKAMNSFLCDTQRRFSFLGRLNEDVNAYTALQRAGLPFLTVLQISLNQMQTQAKSGGLTEAYLESGTYVKSFYSVLAAPSCVKVSVTGTAHPRIHHVVDWNSCAPMILHERHRRP